MPHQSRVSRFTIDLAHLSHVIVVNGPVDDVTVCENRNGLWTMEATLLTVMSPRTKRHQLEWQAVIYAATNFTTDPNHRA